MLRCGLTRLSGDAGHRVLPVLATRDQWSHYWGGSDVQRVGKFFEVTAVAFLGLWACYFASFFLGVATMTVIGTVRDPCRITIQPTYIAACGLLRSTTSISCITCRVEALL